MAGKMKRTSLRTIGIQSAGTPVDCKVMLPWKDATAKALRKTPRGGNVIADISASRAAELAGGRNLLRRSSASWGFAASLPPSASQIWFSSVSAAKEN